MPKPTTTIFRLAWAALKPGLALPSTGSPCRSPSRTGMAGRRDSQTVREEGRMNPGFGWRSFDNLGTGDSFKRSAIVVNLGN